MVKLVISQAPSHSFRASIKNRCNNICKITPKTHQFHTACPITVILLKLSPPPPPWMPLPPPPPHQKSSSTPQRLSPKPLPSPSSATDFFPLSAAKSHPQTNLTLYWQLKLLKPPSAPPPSPQAHPSNPPLSSSPNASSSSHHHHQTPHKTPSPLSSYPSFTIFATNPSTHPSLY